MKTVKLNDHTTYYASGSLVDELRAKMKEDDVVINFAYTDYGGSIIDKYAIEYFEKHYPESIVSEVVSWNGMNAFVFGEVAQRWIDETENYILGFGDFEDYFSTRENEDTTEGYQGFLDHIRDFKSDEFTIAEDAINMMHDEFDGNYSVLTSGLDYCESDLIRNCVDAGILIPTKSDDETVLFENGLWKVQTSGTLYRVYFEGEHYATRQTLDECCEMIGITRDQIN